MDDVFTELNLETLAVVFRREIIVPSIVQSMNNEKIERLDVTATGVRLRELCKEDEEDNSRSSFGSRSVGSPLTNRTDDVREERMRLFNSRGPRSQSKSISVACFSI